MKRIQNAINTLFGRVSFRLKLTLIIFGIILLTSGCITLFSYQASKSAMLAQSEANSQAYLGQVMMRLDTMLQDVHRGVLSITFNKDFLQTLQNNKLLKYNDLLAFIRNQNIITTLTNTNQYIYSIALYDLKSGTYLSTAITNGLIDKNSPDYKLITSLYRSGNSKPIYKWEGTRSIIDRGIKRNVFTFILPADFWSDKNVNAVVLATIKEETICGLFSGNDNSGVEVYLTDNNNIILSASDKDKLGARLTGVPLPGSGLKSFGRTIISGQEYIYTYTTSAYSGWTFYSLVSVKELLRNNVQVLRNSFILIAIITAVVMLLFALLLNMQLYREVELLIQAIKHDDESSDLLGIYRDRKDEIGFLYNSFHGVFLEKKALMKSVFDQTLLLKDAEIRLLHSQINSHFLYNTLDSIIWTAKAKNYERIITMVSAMVTFFRISLDRGKELISVRKAMEQIQSYFTIQRIRYADRLTVELNIDEDICECKVLRFVLQPIVENSVQHGIEKKIGSGFIRVMGRMEDGLLQFVIEDNGVGISPDRLEEVNRVIDSDEDSEQDFSALQNISRRIKLFYGEQYRLTIISHVGEGTAVSIRVPAITG